jgi:hypothetical protein
LKAITASLFKRTSKVYSQGSTNSKRHGPPRSHYGGSQMCSSIPPLIEPRSCSLPNRLKPEPQPVGITGAMAPDPAFGGPQAPNRCPAHKSASAACANFGMPRGIHT